MDENKFVIQLTNSEDEECYSISNDRDYFFPCCPTGKSSGILKAYLKNLKVGAVFAYNEDSPKLIIFEFVKSKNNSSILVMCEREEITCEMDGFMPWIIYEITSNNNLFVHTRLDSYFEKTDADKEFFIRQALIETFSRD